MTAASGISTSHFPQTSARLPRIRRRPNHKSTGPFHVGCEMENHVHRNQSVTVSRAFVDTGGEYTGIPARTLENIGVSREKQDLVNPMANAQPIRRSVGFAIPRVEKNFPIDEVVFGEPGDMTLPGARTFEGLSLMGDSRGKMLVAAGPLPAARTNHDGVPPWPPRGQPETSTSPDDSPLLPRLD